ncbi:C2 domain protein [Dictyocaulus viviparus]|uniref:C2 domain protein n=1 Tax=Dictyocaulus viviparus TaxID=29172 RepID=A0A0D8XM40_DICVI|nr:C2 domain protein [Dictyocaulus viviparus]
MDFFGLAEQNSLLILLIGTVLIVSIIVTTILMKAKAEQITWYEQNLVEMAMDTNYYHCKSFNRRDIVDRTRGTDGTRQQLERYSRVPSLKNTTDKALLSDDVTDKFVIPRSPRISQSMFTNPQKSQIDKGLYHYTPPDESACTDEMGSCGSVQLSLYLDTNLGLLTVSLKQAYDLPNKRQDDNPNPYFRVSLDVPSVVRTQQQTKTFRGTTSPKIDEDFYFQIPTTQVASCRLEIMVYDYDQFSVDECVGYCWLTLGRLNVSLEKNTPTVFWAEVFPYDENGRSGYGEVLFSLAYLSQAQRLTMNIFKVRNLRCRTEGAISIRVLIFGNEDKRPKRKKTASRKNVRNAQFNESLTFGVPKRSLCDITLEIEAIHEMGTFGMNSQVVGRMELPLHKCKDLWRAIIHEEKSKARWYSFEEP